MSNISPILAKTSQIYFLLIIFLDRDNLTKLTLYNPEQHKGTQIKQM